MVDREQLRQRLKDAADHAQFKIDQANKLLDKPTLDVEEIQGISRVLDQLRSISSGPGSVATFDCVG